MDFLLWAGIGPGITAIVIIGLFWLLLKIMPGPQ